MKHNKCIKIECKGLSLDELIRKLLIHQDMLPNNAKIVQNEEGTFISYNCNKIIRY